MEIFEEIEKACDLLKLSENEKRNYLEKIEESNCVQEYNNVLQSIAYRIELYTEKNSLEDDVSLWKFVDVFRTARPFYLVWNHNELDTNNEMAFYFLSEAASFAEKCALQHKGSKSIVFIGVATTQELEEAFFDNFETRREFDEESEIDEDLLVELVNADFLIKPIYSISF